MVTTSPRLSLTKASVKRRGAAILGPIDLDFATEGFTIVLGPNGAGKTTLLKVLHGVERLSSGTCTGAAPEDQAYVFQTPVMLRRSVRQNLAYPLELVKKPKAEVAQAVARWADRIGLGEALDRPATRLSGGEKQKLALGRALIRQPKVLFLDEPCANLDGSSTREIEGLLLQAQADGTRVIMSTHNIGQARRLAHDVIFLVGGRVEATGPAATFFDAPPTAATTAFLKGDIIE